MNQVARYSIGFIGSVVLTLTAYLLVTQSQLMGQPLMIGLASLAIVQFVLQMLCFLHLGQEARPRLKLFMFVNMIAIVALIVFGSLWIMNNLHYHMGSSHDMDARMMRESNKGF